MSWPSVPYISYWLTAHFCAHKILAQTHHVYAYMQKTHAVQKSILMKLDDSDINIDDKSNNQIHKLQ